LSELTELEADIDAAREPNERKPVITARSLFGDRWTTVSAVIKAYRLISAAPPLVCVNLDPQPESRSHKWTPVGAEFCADVCGQVRKYLRDRPDRVQLRAAWTNLCENDNPVIKDAEKRLILALGVLFEKNGIVPSQYFKPRVKTRSPW